MSESGNSSDVRVIQLTGHVRVGDALEKLRRGLEAAEVDGIPRVVLSMAGVRSMDSSCIGLLVRHMTLARQKGGAVKLAAVPAGAAQALQITGILRLFEVFPSEEDAVASFEKKQP
ncbi:MAG: STAS domain-containing protein [Acidobacteriales bacterium]|nr:STAS domain-containing protein [Terriglobales bacterium]